MIDFASATPHGLACFTITQAGLLNSLTHSQAASASTILLYESSFPWIISALAIFLFFKLSKVKRVAFWCGFSPYLRFTLLEKL